MCMPFSELSISCKARNIFFCPFCSFLTSALTASKPCHHRASQRWRTWSGFKVIIQNNVTGRATADITGWVRCWELSSNLKRTAKVTKCLICSYPSARRDDSNLILFTLLLVHLFSLHSPPSSLLPSISPPRSFCPGLKLIDLFHKSPAP